MGTAGPQGPMGPAGTNTDGSTDPPVSCLSPCHGFNGVVAQFETSAHYVAYVMNLGSSTAAEWVTPASPCGNCHAIDALSQRVAGNVLTSDDGGVANLASGELQYRDPVTGALSSANYRGSAAIAEVYCTTCHAITDENDPHQTGTPWTPGSFPLAVYTGPTDTITLEKSPTVGPVVGTPGGAYGTGDTCMWCHRSPVDVTNDLVPTANVITTLHWGPHEGPQADIFTAVGGYAYAGQSYGTSTHQQNLTCIDCHMVGVADNRYVADHSFNATLSACKPCHVTATTFDVNGFQSQIKAALTEIQRSLNDRGLLTRSQAAPYTPLTSAELGDGNWNHDQPLPGATVDGGLLTGDQAGALYNYLLVARGGAFGVHNPKYVAELLYDSFYSLTGSSLSTFPQRPQ